MLSSILSSLLVVVRQYPVELLIFLVLLWITVNRRDLSANRAYRKKKKGPSGGSSLRAPALTQEDLAQGMRVVSMKASDMSERMREIFNSNAAMLQHSLGGAAAEGQGGESRPPARRSPLERLLLNKDMSLAVFSCLEAVDISSLCTTSRSFLGLHDPEFIWQQLWMQRYGRRVWRSAALATVRQRRGIRWNPYANWGPPAQGWKLFFMEFEFGWMDWLLAGANTRDLCLLGYRGHVLDVTAFVDAHPGSGETLLDNAGCECSAMVEEIGHSSFAHSLMQSFSVTAAHPSGGDGGAVEQSIAGSVARGDTQSDSASEDEGGGGERFVCRPRSQLEARLALERTAALRIAESHRVTMYPVPAACGMKHKGKSLGHMKPVFGVLDVDLDDPFVIVSDAELIAPSSGSAGGVSSLLVKMCPVAVGRGVSQESFAPHLSTAEGLQDLAMSAANSMWKVVMSVVSATVNAPQADSGVAFAEWITVRNASRNAPSQQAPVSAHIADELLSGIKSGEFTCCDLASNMMWQRAAVTAGILLPHPPTIDQDEASDAVLLEYVFDTAGVSPVTAQQFRDLPPAVPHMGQPKVFYDPLVQEWAAWWSCCRVSYSLDQAAINKECVQGSGS